MPALIDEVWEWLDRAEQAREVAGQLTDPAARKAVFQLAESFDRLGHAALDPPPARRRGRSPPARTGSCDLSRPLELEAEIDDLLREKEEVEKWATVGSA